MGPSINLRDISIFLIRFLYGICLFALGLISFIPNIMMSISGSHISVYLGMIGSFLFCSSGILELLNLKGLPLNFANISLGLAVLLQISALVLLIV